LIKVCESLSRDAVVRAGGNIETDSEGKETYVIPVQKLVVDPVEQCWEPKEIVGDVQFTADEMKKIVIRTSEPE
jgi:hypothetical protein